MLLYFFLFSHVCFIILSVHVYYVNCNAKAQMGYWTMTCVH